MANPASTTVLKLNNGVSIPQLGFGLYKTPTGEVAQNAVRWALEAGYRHFDTAAVYKNEQDVGAAIRKSGIPRQEIFITTKLFNSDHGYDAALRAFDASLQKLGLDYVDLYLIHSPLPGKELRLASWKAMEKLYEEGKVRSIGVSNYGIHHLEELLAVCKVKPACNQVEIHPWLGRGDLVQFCRTHDILIEAYSPLTRGIKLQDAALVAMAEKYHRSTAQLLIRWGLQHGYVSLPKSEKRERIVQNTDVFGWEISEEDMKALDALDCYYITLPEWDPTVAP